MHHYENRENCRYAGKRVFTLQHGMVPMNNLQTMISQYSIRCLCVRIQLKCLLLKLGGVGDNIQVQGTQSFYNLKRTAMYRHLNDTLPCCCHMHITRASMMLLSSALALLILSSIQYSPWWQFVSISLSFNFLD